MKEQQLPCIPSGKAASEIVYTRGKTRKPLKEITKSKSLIFALEFLFLPVAVLLLQTK